MALSLLALIGQLSVVVRMTFRSKAIVIKISRGKERDEIEIADISKPSENEMKDVALWMAVVSGDKDAVAEVGRRKRLKAPQ
ncbi:MAG: hypothetical protein DI528_21585 [Shinella sp.]|nr:MAG: hypothetical protein DI528_21585 [Shinella sp.]